MQSTSKFDRALDQHGIDVAKFKSTNVPKSNQHVFLLSSLPSRAALKDAKPIKAKSIGELSCLDVFIIVSDLPAVRSLSSNRELVNRPNKQGITPAQIAATFTNYAALLCLFDAGADFEKTRPTVYTILKGAWIR